MRSSCSEGDGDFEELQIDATVAGRYLIAVKGFKSTTGNFELTLH